MESTFSLSRQHDGRQHLLLHGSFPPHWPGNLTAALAARRISIIAARATKKRFDWDATFELDLNQFVGAMEEIDFIELLHTEPRHLPDENVKLTRYSLQRLPTGDLEVAISGPDQIGFLARLLRKWTNLNLFPREFDIETLGDRVRDRFVLGGIGNLRPTPAVLTALEGTLAGMTDIPPASRS